jgi:predicted AAA+ superfamily ATPase
MDRIYHAILKDHYKNYPQMAFLVGPRQVGKTTIAKQLQKDFSESIYLNWDVISDREKILSGQTFIQDIFSLSILRDEKPLVIFDEIHKYKHWKNYLKGFFDLYKDHYHILVTGSARLDIYQAGGDSLMGRYFQYSVHPLTLRELLDSNMHAAHAKDLFAMPSADESNLLQRLFYYGGFPDPFLKSDSAFSNLWQATRLKQLFFEDILTVAQIHDVHLMEVLAEVLKEQSGQLLNRSSLAKKIKVTAQTISRWLETLERFYYCFAVPPWHKNVTRSLIKEPKLFLWDWSVIKNEGGRFENMLAVSLLKFCKFWSEQGKHNFDLYYLRDIDKKEVDFLITKDRTPYLMVEVKLSDLSLSKHLWHFQRQLQAPFNLQVTYNLKAIEQTCFKDDGGIYIAPAVTFLSQLV